MSMITREVTIYDNYIIIRLNNLKKVLTVVRTFLVANITIILKTK